MPTKTLRVETVAQAYLELLRDRGIDCFFANAVLNVICQRQAGSPKG